MALAPRSRPNEGLAGWGEPVVEAQADIPVRLRAGWYFGADGFEPGQGLSFRRPFMMPCIGKSLLRLLGA